jgi:hypothetical protein
MTSSNDPHHQAHLSYDELLGKLDQVQRLMNITGWTEQANQDYYQLFGVDKEKEALRKGKSPVSTTWEPKHRLEHFGWDEACEYPVPSDFDTDGNEVTVVGNPSQEPKEKSISKKYDLKDECTYQNLLTQLKGGSLY